jgi:hypothetical protein
MSRSRLALLALSVAALAGLLLAGMARADYDPISSGRTELTLEKSFLALLKHAGVKVSAVAPARLKGGTVTFPADGGKFDPVAEKGTVEHEGALLFQAGQRKIPLKALKLRTTQKHSPFSAKAGGSQLKLATAQRVEIAREGFGDVVRVADLSMSAKLATRLGKKLDRRGVFKAGIPLGSSVTTAEPETISILNGGSATLTLAPGLVAKLESLFVAVNPIFPAEHQGPVFTLPISGGEISVDATAGSLDTSGSIELLQLGGGQVFLHGPLIDLTGKTISAEVDVEPSPPYAGNAGLLPIAPLAPAGPVTANPVTRTISVPNSALTLGVSLAANFNETFAKPQGKEAVFAPGEELGVITFSVKGN